ncbi:MAG: 50S ribosomal protein L9 [Pelagibacteraceae bacterium]|jgi:large subunit ribosomal protein L9|nr:50S ribosomal protein L9 [Pelagibacteraceae bacterium]MBT4645282.1 50S ribosomal protein L9 [Pelagibacteraceae bacterium]MBT4950250.1 50S ribosomal protein L9 [Pelagibacteraceae bacterium]MBT5213995.1 50S ribosomal protein L9 [Pelagibacteraceae bacterium]MBT6197646.1 50S ribosomal protein L9 [Pelagibacteraceae bacterium]
MKVILTTNIKKLGKIGELVNVKDGYARNYLFPNNMALRENKKNLEHYDKIKEEVKIKEDKKLQDAKQIIEKIKNLNIEFNREADEKDQLYGSISKKEIINYLKENGIIIHSDDIFMKNSLRTIGEHEVVVSPYIDMTFTIIVKVNKN